MSVRHLGPRKTINSDAKTCPLFVSAVRKRLQARLVLEHLRVPYETRFVDLSKRAQRDPEYLKVNPLGQLPALVDRGTTLWDSHAIATYLVEQYGGAKSEPLLPSSPIDWATIFSWVYFDAVELHFGIGLARNHFAFGVPLDGEGALKRVHRALSVLERKLAVSEWLEFDRVTLADLTCYPLVSLSSEATIDLSAYPSVDRWTKRVESLSIPPKPTLEAYRRALKGEPA